MPTFVGPTEWSESKQCYQRICFEDGKVYHEHWLDEDFARNHGVHEQERKRDNWAGMERISAVPLWAMNVLYYMGYPVFDPEEGDAALLSGLRKHFPDFLTCAAKGLERVR